VIGAFCTLTFYDFFALGPSAENNSAYRIAACRSFTSDTIGQIRRPVSPAARSASGFYSDYG